MGHFHCFAVDLRGTGDSYIDIPDSAIRDAFDNQTILLPEWLTPSATLPTLEGYAEDIKAIAEHLSWKGRSLFYTARPASFQPNFSYPTNVDVKAFLPILSTNIARLSSLIVYSMSCFAIGQASSFLFHSENTKL